HVAADGGQGTGPYLDHQIAMAGAAVEIVQGGAATAARGADQVADLRRVLVEPPRDQGGARPVRPLDQALDIDRVALVGAEEVARHAGALDVPRDEGSRPRHVVEPAALG